MRGIHSGAHQVGKICRDGQEDCRVYQWLMAHGDESDGRADACAHQAKLAVTLEFEPLQASADVTNGLAIGLERETDIGTNKMVGAFTAGNHAAIVIRHGKTQGGDYPAIEPRGNFYMCGPRAIGLQSDTR